MHHTWTGLRSLGLVVGLSLVWLSGCDERVSYSQRSPDEVVKSAVAMVQNGDADRLDDLIYADSEKMRAVLNRLGVTLGHVQLLAATLQAKFPEEIAKLKAETEQAAAEGRSAGGLSAMFSGGRVNVEGGGGRPSGPPGFDEGSGRGERSDGRSRMEGILTRLLADPYGWIESNAPRLSTVKLADDMATVTLDDKPVLPPIGIPLKQDKGLWFVSLPLHLPPLSGYMPATDEEWSIIGSLIAVLDRAVVEIHRDVESGKVGSLNAVGDELGDKVIFPGMMAFAAYGMEMDVRQRRNRAIENFKKRQREWVKSRRERSEGRAGGGTESAVPDVVERAIDSVRAAALDKVTRKRESRKFDGLTDAEFEDLAERWLQDEGLVIELSGDLSGSGMTEAVQQWLEARKTATGSGKRR
ncbi:MAG: hypothetical protein H7Y88_01500 [Phycisphaerales bacterium]|nr:hypothetical protein [Phycisphaerales bacterium]